MGRAKPLLEIEGSTFVQRICERMLWAGVDDLRVILGHYVEEVVAVLPADERVRWIHNPDYDSGQLSSLQAGLRAGRCDRKVMMALVDHPTVLAETYARLLQVDGQIVIPTHGGRRGHPMVWGATVLDELLAGPLDRGARAVVRKDPERVVEVAVDDPGILADVDLPEDYATISSSAS